MKTTENVLDNSDIYNSYVTPSFCRDTERVQVGCETSNVRGILHVWKVT